MVCGLLAAEAVLWACVASTELFVWCERPGSWAQIAGSTHCAKYGVHDSGRMMRDDRVWRCCMSVGIEHA